MNSPEDRKGKRSWIIWIGGSALLLLGTIWVSLHLWQPVIGPLLRIGPKGEFWSQLAQQEDQGSSSIPISRLTNFEWDKVCLFYGYGDSPLKILKAEGINDIPPKHRKRAESTEQTSDIVFFAFSLNGRVVQSFTENSSVYINGGNQSIEFERNCVRRSVAIIRVERSAQSINLIFTEEKH